MTDTPRAVPALTLAHAPTLMLVVLPTTQVRPSWLPLLEQCVWPPVAPDARRRQARSIAAKAAQR